MVRRRRQSDKKLVELYNKRARQWGERYMMRHWWRIKAMYDLDDIRQDCFGVYLRVYRRHPGKSEEDLFRIYKRGIQGRVDNRSKQCFPNSYAYVANQGKLVVELDDLKSSGESTGDLETFLVYWSDILSRLPGELADVLKLLIKDFLGVECIEQRRRRRLSGRNRVEPLELAIARALRVDPARDLLSELDVVIDSVLEQRDNEANQI